MRFSIIVPVYNVEKYIGKCMETLVNQSFRDYEIIIVDDESPDGSMEIVESFRRKDPERIRVVHQKNTRQGGARNHGVTLARGDYLMFVDSDDYLDLRCLETVEQRLQQTPCDILVFQHRQVREGGEPLGPVDLGLVRPGFYVPRQQPEVVLLPCGPVNKVYRREFYLASGVQFPEKLLYEDCITRLLYAKARSILVTGDVLYNYVNRENSSMTQKLSPKMLDILKMADIVREAFAREGLYETFREPLEISLIYSLLCIEEIINTREPDNPMQVPIADYVSAHFKDYSSNAFASPELIRLLDCLTAHDFRRYHRRLRLNGFKDRLLQIGAVQRLNELRKKI